MISQISFSQITRSANYKVESGDTLSRIMQLVDINNSDIYYSSTKIDEIYKIKQIRPGDNVKIIYKKGPSEDNNTLLQLIVDKSKLEKVVASRNEEGKFDSKIVKKPTKTKLIKASGDIEYSLFDTMNDLKVPASISYDLAKKLVFDIDFQRDLRKGNKIEILYEEIVTFNDEVVDTGDIIYASLKLRNNDIKIYRFEDKDGDYGYFSETGKSIEKSLLRTPVDGARISSRFGKRRHPILGYSKMHKGVDFAATRGTPIYSAGSGKIAKIYRSRSYGNYIKINHSNGYSTAYAHMQKFKRGLKKGSKVKQGEVIGYVGSTGRSTGPHLHYEILKNNKQINPLSVKTIATKQLKGVNLGIFKNFSKSIDEVIAMNDNKKRTQVSFAQNLEKAQ